MNIYESKCYVSANLHKTKWIQIDQLCKTLQFILCLKSYTFRAQKQHFCRPLGPFTPNTILRFIARHFNALLTSLNAVQCFPAFLFSILSMSAAFLNAVSRLFFCSQFWKWVSCLFYTSPLHLAFLNSGMHSVCSLHDFAIGRIADTSVWSPNTCEKW